MKIFDKYLQDMGLPDTRTYDIARALDQLHSAICQLDRDNQLKFGFYMPEAVECAVQYAQHEELNEDLWGGKKPTWQQDLARIDEGMQVIFIPDFEVEEPEPEKPKPKGHKVVKMEDYRDDS